MTSSAGSRLKTRRTRCSGLSPSSPARRRRPRRDRPGRGRRPGRRGAPRRPPRPPPRPRLRPPPPRARPAPRPLVVCSTYSMPSSRTRDDHVLDDVVGELDRLEHQDQVVLGEVAAPATDRQQRLEPLDRHTFGRRPDGAGRLVNLTHSCRPFRRARLATGPRLTRHRSRSSSSSRSRRTRAITGAISPTVSGDRRAWASATARARREALRTSRVTTTSSASVARFLNRQAPQQVRHPGIVVLGRLDRLVEVVGPGERLEGGPLELVGEQERLEPVGRPARGGARPGAAPRGPVGRRRHPAAAAPGRARRDPPVAALRARGARRALRARRRCSRPGALGPCRPPGRPGRRKASGSSRHRSATSIRYWSRTSSLGCSATTASAASAALARPSAERRSADCQDTVHPEGEERLGVGDGGAERVGVVAGQVGGIGARRAGRRRPRRPRGGAPTRRRGPAPSCPAASAS